MIKARKSRKDAILELHDDWKEAMEGQTWIINYDADIPDEQKGAISRQKNGKFQVWDGGSGDERKSLANLSEEQVLGALNQLGIANTGWS